MQLFANTHEKQKKIYSTCKESNKFASQINLTPKEIDIKDNVIEVEKRKDRSKNIRNKSVEKKIGTKTRAC